MPPFARREFSGNSVPTTITSTIAAGDLTINIASSTGWPTGATGPFIVTLDQGLATEEKVEVASRTGLVLTVTPTGRGHDSTAAVGHGSGSKIEHTMAARDLAEANAHNADVTRDDHSQYLNPARHAAEVHAIDTAEIVDGSVTSAKLEAAQRWLPGDFKWGIQAASHTGWLLCNGAAVSQATYAALFAVMGGHIFGADPGGGNFLLPDLRKKYLMGKAAAGVGSTLGGSFGSADAVVVTHVHNLGNHTHGAVTGGEAGHTHNANHGHTADDNVSGSHEHSPGGTGGDLGYRFLITWGGATNEKIAGGTTPGIIGNMVPTDLDAAGAHDHNITVNPNNFNTAAGSNHTHGIPADNGNTGSTGQAATDANLPPSMAVNGFIHI